MQQTLRNQLFSAKISPVSFDTLRKLFHDICFVGFFVSSEFQKGFSVPSDKATTCSSPPTSCLQILTLNQPLVDHRVAATLQYFESDFQIGMSLT